MIGERQLNELRYQLRLDAPVLVTTLAGDPNTMRGERYLPGASLLGAFAARWIAARGLRQPAHQDAVFARFFLRGGLTFLNALPEDPEQEHIRLLPAPRSLWQPKLDDGQCYDLSVEAAEEAERRVDGFCRIDAEGVQTFQSKMRLRLHTERADRLIGRPTATDGALFAYEALEGGQTFIGSVLGGADDLAELAGGLGWVVEPLSMALGRSRSAEYGGQARLRLLTPRSTPFSGEVSARQRPAAGLVLTLTSPLLPDPAMFDDGRLAFPFGDLALCLSEAGIAIEVGALRRGCRGFTQATLVGGYSGVWGMPRPQVPGFAAGSVFHFPDGPAIADVAELIRAEQSALGRRTAEGYGRFALNWHGELDGYALRTAVAPRRRYRPTGTVPDAFRHVALEVARSRAADAVRAEARRAAGDARRLPSPSLLRRMSDLLREIDVARASTLRVQLQAQRHVAARQLARCTLSGAPLADRLVLLCSPDLEQQRPALRALLGIQDRPAPLRQVLDQAGHGDTLDAPEQLARLATLFVQVVCAEMARLQRGRGERYER